VDAGGPGALDGGVQPDGGVQGGDGGQLPAGPDGGCGAVRATGTLGRQPVDVVLVIDNSGSMGDEIQAVEDSLNTSFAEVLTDAGVDWRLVLLGKHGPAVPDESICIEAPLSANATCSPPPATPANTARFFHYSVEVGSSNAWPLLLSTFAAPDPSGAADGGWEQWLRPGAFKTILVMTDDDPSWSADAFDTQLLALSPLHFGDAGTRNYRFHSVIGVEPPSAAALQGAWPASSPPVTAKCPTAVNTGDPYQQLSILTGGLRLSICDPSAYPHLFEVLAGDVVAGAQLQCAFAVPPPPPGYSAGNRIAVEVSRADGGVKESWTQLVDAAGCGPGRFYVEAGQVVLCPSACDALRAQGDAAVEVLFTCEPLIQ
jgi:hypothetical protein